MQLKLMTAATLPSSLEVLAMSRRVSSTMSVDSSKESSVPSSMAQ